MHGSTIKFTVSVSEKSILFPFLALTLIEALLGVSLPSWDVVEDGSRHFIRSPSLVAAAETPSCSHVHSIPADAFVHAIPVTP